mmetsp:Transcript_39461/g.156697  ORF Transcript_39461/g.156697 Transcript_39461/m.156697 type:complete len:105 (+) Transcript_39461:1542-1856(+)
MAAGCRRNGLLQTVDKLARGWRILFIIKDSRKIQSDSSVFEYVPYVKPRSFPTMSSPVFACHPKSPRAPTARAKWVFRAQSSFFCIEGTRAAMKARRVTTPSPA